jgi:hypothetical protein
MSNFDDISKIQNNASAKALQLEKAIRSGQFKKQIKHDNNNDSKENISSSSDSDDYADEELDEVGALSKNLNEVRKKLSSNKLTVDPTIRKSLAIKSKSYLSLNEEDFKEHNITGFRMMLARSLGSKVVDITLLILTSFYTFLVLVLMGFDRDFYDNNSGVEITFQVIEFIILAIFISDVIARIYAYRGLYFSEKFNIVDIILVSLAVVLAIIDVPVDDPKASAFLRLRGIFRLLRVGVVFLRFEEQSASNINKLKSDVAYSDYKSPLERTLEILTSLKECINDDKFVKDINFCIKHISNGKLYDIEINEPETLGFGNLRRSRRGGILAMEENLWIRSCSSASQTRKLSRMSSVIISVNRKSSSLQNKVGMTKAGKKMLENVDSLSFNIFEFNKELNGGELVAIANMLFEKHNLFKTMKINSSKFLTFTKNIMGGYKHVPYHNKTHGADVAQTLYFFLMKGDWMTKGEMDNLDLISMIVGGSIHDYEHPGYNAAFLMKTNDKLTVRYNDISILENHHLAASFELLNLTENNFLEKVPIEDRKEIRKMMIEMVLSTDMSKHFADLGKFKSRIAAPNFDPSGTDKQLVMNMGMHIADISNPSKPWDVSFKWTEWLYEEFFGQGDKERSLGMQISDLMDRTTINIAKSSIGFIDVIVEPAYVAFSKFLPHIQENIDNIQKNKAKWQGLIGEYQEKVREAQEYFEANPPKVFVEAESDVESSNNTSSVDSSFNASKSGAPQGGPDSSRLGSLLSAENNDHLKVSNKK